MFRRRSAEFIAVLLFAVPGWAMSPLLEAALKSNDVTKLEAMATTAATLDEQTLAKGSALSLRHKDAAAAAILEPLARGAGDNAIRANAWMAVQGVYFRQGRFAEAAKAGEAVRSLRAEPLTVDEIQTIDFANALSGVKPMKLVKKVAGKLEVTRDVAGLARVPVTINGHTIAAVVDSGAGFSTVCETAAKKLGLRILERTAAVGSSSKDTVNSHLGVAASLRFGDAVLTDVVFIVLPDSDLTFGNGAYSIEAIVGLPVFEALGRIELAKENGKETLSYGAKANAPASGNLILDGVEPLVLVDAGGSQLRMMIDTGATTTTLNASTARDYPTLTATAVKTKVRREGAGGVSEDADGLVLPTLRLTIGGRNFDVTKVRIHSKPLDREHGAIGQDVLKQGTRWALDFETMSFTVGN